MKKNYPVLSFLVILLAFVSSCGSDDPAQDYEPVSPVVLDLEIAPYDSLSKYKFFEGEMKNLQPAYKVLPYDLSSSLFTDYALKKRFIWMPEGATATYTSGSEVPNFPIGTVLIKNFYYDDVYPDHSTIITETRLMIRKENKWVFATYVWNDEQTEAVLDMAGSNRRMVWYYNGSVRNITYHIPSEGECYMCHQHNNSAIPIGPKPQNINKPYSYADGVENQLSRWVAAGYLDSYPPDILSTVSWEDTSQSLELRVRSYLDANCAHCHTDGGQCDYTPMDLAFSKTSNPVNLGVCVVPQDFVTGNQTHIVAKQRVELSLLHFRMSTNDPLEMMPITGRSVVHEEALTLIEQWINSMDSACP